MRLQVDMVSLRLAEPFQRAHDTVSSVHELVVEIDDGVHQGLGSARMSDEEWLARETVREAERRLVQRLTDGPVETSTTLAVDLPRPLRVAVDVALVDLAAHRRDESIAQMWGLDCGPLQPSAITIGIRPQQALLERVYALRAWPILKLKVGRDFDPHVLGEVREVYHGRLWLDANGLLDPASARGLISRVAEFDIELVEQPVPTRQIASLSDVRRATPIAFAVDGEVASPADVGRLRGVDVVNVKVDRCGGLSGALRVATAAIASDIKVMVGCRTQSVLGVSAAAQLASLGDYLDLDGHLDILDDPFEGLCIRQGTLCVPARPGHGARRRDPATTEERR